jgi:hypothetical protein
MKPGLSILAATIGSIGIGGSWYQPVDPAFAKWWQPVAASSDTSPLDFTGASAACASGNRLSVLQAYYGNPKRYKCSGRYGANWVRNASD